MDLRKKERKERLRKEREYREHVMKKERIRAFLTYLRAILPLIRDCEERGAKS